MVDIFDLVRQLSAPAEAPASTGSYSGYDPNQGLTDPSVAAAQAYYGVENYPSYDWSQYMPRDLARSEIVNTVYGPAYTPQYVNNPLYEGMWPYTPADSSGGSYISELGAPMTNAEQMAAIIAAQDPSIRSTATYYGHYNVGSGSGGGGGSGDVAPGPTLPIWDPYYALMQLLPSPSATPQEQYQYYTSPMLEQLGQKIMPIVYSDVMQDNGTKFPSWEEIRDQTQRIIDTSSAWAPGGENVSGPRRTMAQQAEYEKAMTPLWNYQLPLPPITGSGQGMADIQRRQAYGQEAWDLWQPALQQLLGPETMKGGSPDWLRPASGLTGAAPYRVAPQNALSSGTNWSFAPRWG